MSFLGYLILLIFWFQGFKVKAPYPTWNICQLCYKNSTLFRCSACKTVKYCSKQCQIMDWSNHKDDCVKCAQKTSQKNRTERSASTSSSTSKWHVLSTIGTFVRHIAGLLMAFIHSFLLIHHKSGLAHHKILPH